MTVSAPRGSPWRSSSTECRASWAAAPWPTEAHELREEPGAEHFPGADVRLRETGRYIVAEVHGARAPSGDIDLSDYWTGDPEHEWRFAELSFAPSQKRG